MNGCDIFKTICVVWIHLFCLPLEQAFLKIAPSVKKTHGEKIHMEQTPTMTQRLQAAHCLLYALPPALVLPTFRMSLKIPFVLQCESNGFPHPSPSVVLLET